MREEVGVVVGGPVCRRQQHRRRPVRVRAVSVAVRPLHVRLAAIAVEVHVHHVDPVEGRIRLSVHGQVAVDRDPLLVRLLAKAGVGREDVVRPAVVGREPSLDVGRAVRTDGNRDSLVVDPRVGLVAGLIFLKPALVVVELIRQKRLVVVAPVVESAHRVGVVGEALVTGHMPHGRPGLAAVPRLVETQQVVVAFGAREPLARADDVVRVRGVDPDVRLRMVGHQHRRRRRIARSARRLRSVGADLLACGRAGARQLAGVAVVRSVVERGRHLGCIAAHLLARDEDIRHRMALDSRESQPQL